MQVGLIDIRDAPISGQCAAAPAVVAITVAGLLGTVTTDESSPRDPDARISSVRPGGGRNGRSALHSPVTFVETRIFPKLALRVPAVTFDNFPVGRSAGCLARFRFMPLVMAKLQLGALATTSDKRPSGMLLVVGGGAPEINIIANRA